MTRGTLLGAAALALVALAGCASSGGGGGTYRGVQVYEEGAEVYVCREAHTADTRDALVAELESGQPVTGASTGQTVDILSREDVQVGDRTVSVARVEAAGGSRYWIPYSALCSRGG